MPIFDDVDTGRASQSAGPGYASPSSIGDDSSVQRSQTIDIMAPAIGGQNAFSKAAAKLVAVQLSEMVDSVRFVQWESGAGVLAPSPFDGWWHIDSVEPIDLAWSNHVSVRVSATLVELDSLRRAVRYLGGALSSDYTGPAIALIPYPVGSTAMVGSIGSRASAEGAIPYTLNPLGGVTRLPYLPSATIANRFLGIVKVYDSMSVGGNPPPTSGAATHASWVRVYGSNHVFTGDMILTNGLVLMVFQVGQARLARVYAWSGTGFSTPQWLQWADLFNADNAAGVGMLRTIDLPLVTRDRVSVTLEASTSGGQVAEMTVTERSGLLSARLDFRPLTQSNTVTNSLYLQLASGNVIAFTSTGIADPRLAADQLLTTAPPTDYGYLAGFTPSTSYPVIGGLQWRNRPAQGIRSGGNTLLVADTSGPAAGDVRTYGLFVFGFGTPTTTTDKLQGEAESGTLVGAAVSAADALASAGNACKIPSGGTLGSATTFGTSFIPQAGNYRLAFRIRTGTNGAGSTNELRCIATGIGAPSQFFLKANQVTTTYAWFQGPSFALDGATAVRFEADAQITATVDWFIDEAVLIPVTLGPDNRSPQEIWQHSMYEYDLVPA